MIQIKNKNKVFLNEWATLEDLQKSPIDPDRGPNTEAGLCALLQDKEARLGVFYETARGRQIYQFLSTVFLLHADESECFRGELEIFFSGECETSELLSDDLVPPMRYWTVDRVLCDESSRPLYVPDEHKNNLILAIADKIVDWKDLTFKEDIYVPLELFEKPQSQRDHIYDFYASCAAEAQEEEKYETLILEKILKFLS